MAFPDPKTPNRKQLFKILGSHDLVKTFEKLFERAGDINPSEIEEAIISAGTAGAKANQAISTNIENETRIDEALALIWLTTK